jgi:hypothetical protein
MQDDAVTLDHSFQQFDEMLPVAVRMEKLAASQPAGRDMVPPSWRMMS